MWFKNLQGYRLVEPTAWAIDDLEEALTARAAAPIGESRARRVGWSAPGGKHGDRLVREVKGQRLMVLQVQERMLPPAVVKETVDERADALEKQQGYPPRRRERVALKERITEELLPRAFVRTSYISIWWDTRRHLIGVDAGSAKRAEDALDLLRETLGSLKVVPLAPKTPAGRTMSEWVRNPDTRPDGLCLGERVVLRARGDDGKLSASHIDVDGDEVRTSMEVGRQVDQLAIGLEENLTALLGADMSLRSIRFADALQKEADKGEYDDDPMLQLDAEFVLMAWALGHFIDTLLHWLGGETKTEISPESAA